MTSELKIRTPEGIVFSYELAGPITRCIAWILDFGVTMVLTLALSLGLKAAGMLSQDIANGLMFVGYYAISIGYSIVCEAHWRGQTLGKRALRLRVMDSRGVRLQLHQVLLRNLLRPVDSLPVVYLVGGIACLISRKAQRIGDLVAGTVVVHNAVQPEPDLEQLLGTRYNSLREHPHLVARLRQRVGPDEARLALETLVRREELDPTTRVELFRDLAAHFDRIVPFPAQLRETLPDEQFVRNVADVLFRTSTPVSATRELAGATAGANR